MAACLVSLDDCVALGEVIGDGDHLHPRPPFEVALPQPVQGMCLQYQRGLTKPAVGLTTNNSRDPERLTLVTGWTGTRAR